MEPEDEGEAELDALVLALAEAATAVTVRSVRKVGLTPPKKYEVLASQSEP